MLQLVVIIALFIFLLWKKSIQLPRDFPPGPTPLPLFGSLLSIRPYPHLFIEQYIQKYKSKVIGVKLGSRKAVFISDPAIIHEAYVTKWKNYSDRPQLPSSDNFAYAEQGGHSLGGCNGEHWKRYRKVVGSTLTKHKMKFMHQHLEDELVEFDKQISHVARIREPVAIIFYTERFSLNVIQRIGFSSYFSYDKVDDNELMENLKTQITALGEHLGQATHIGDFIPFLAFLDSKNKKETRAITDSMMELANHTYVEHQQTLDPENPRDMLDELLICAKNTDDPKFFTKLDILVISIGQYFAGTDTTSATIEWFVYFLAKFPEWQDKIYHEIENTIGLNQLPSYSILDRTPLLAAAIKESHRMRPTATFGGLPRVAVEDDHLGGYYIPKDTIIFWNIWGYAHDPTIWKDHDMFNPERFLEPQYKDIDLHFFGAGPRMCPGSSLAQEEIYIVCALLCQRYKWEFSSPQGNDIDNGVQTLTFKPHPFNVVVSKRI